MYKRVLAFIALQLSWWYMVLVDHVLPFLVPECFIAIKSCVFTSETRINIKHELVFI